MTKPKLQFKSPDDVEAVFYEAFTRCDPDVMAGLWSDEGVVCVHPGSGAIVDYDAIIRSWANIFSNADRTEIKFTVLNRVVSDELAVHVVTEEMPGPVNTMRIPIDGGHFFAGQGALSAVYLVYISESATRSCAKMAPSLRVGSPMRPGSVAHRLFGTTKLHSARLVWPHWRANAGHPHSVNRP
jgi:hypothetical protein